MVGIVLIAFYSVLPGAQAPRTFQHQRYDNQYQLLINHYILLYGQIRAEMDAPVLMYGVGRAIHHPNEIRGNIVDLRLQQRIGVAADPQKNKQPQQKRYVQQNNNRVDRPNRAQINRHINQPMQRNQKRFDAQRRYQKKSKK